MEQPIGPQARSRPKMNYACEACRAAKLKCQPGTQPGICKRCSEFKRECVFRTGPRTRRPKAYSTRPDAQVPPPPPGPSQTFQIDFSMPPADELSLDFDELRLRHESYIEDLVPSSSEDDYDYDDEFEDARDSIGNPTTRETFNFNDLSSGNIPTPSSSSVSTSSRKPGPGSASKASRAMGSLGIKPQFNLDSATRMLSSFVEMLPHCPIMVLPSGDDADVRSMARDSPFVLLAILAVTSCSSSLQGHSLYDEEFRKVLGLKFVAGGERTLELLQGLLIYCSWYPFHLRPKNKQMFQYLRMAVDIVRDLELEQESDMADLSDDPHITETRLQHIRAYLACFYSYSTSIWAWAKAPDLKYTPWMAKCCDYLEKTSQLRQDHILVWLVRIQYILDELIETQKTFGAFRDQQSRQHRQLILLGLETQLRDFQNRIPSTISKTPSIFMSSLTADMYLVAAPLMRTPKPSASRVRNGATITESDPSSSAIDPQKLLAIASSARTFLAHIASQSRQTVSHFCGADWARFIVAVIFGLRLSFPAGHVCAGYDHVAGRRVLDYGARLRELIALCGAVDEEEGKGEEKGKKGGGEEEEKKKKGTKGTDAVAAMRVVLGSVKDTFERKIAAEEQQQLLNLAISGGKACPMINGTLSQYLPLWDGNRQQQQGQHGGHGPSTSYATSYSGLSGSSGSGGSTSGILSNQGFVNMPAGFEGMGQIGATSAGADAADGVTEDRPLVFHDLWATMTMGWAEDMEEGGEISLEGNPGYTNFTDS
ncbi:hypothetical protein F4810DRAFT_657776 [Camillea tinctor]|nr:hypothetical protein F4810DRAFT_657776 [Camillea tinctor]